MANSRSGTGNLEWALNIKKKIIKVFGVSIFPFFGKNWVISTKLLEIITSDVLIEPTSKTIWPWYFFRRKFWTINSIS